MKRMTIEFGNKRIVVYVEGGCHVEEYLPAIGWVMIDDMDNGHMSLMLEGIKTLAIATEKMAAA